MELIVLVKAQITGYLNKETTFGSAKSQQLKALPGKARERKGQGFEKGLIEGEIKKFYCYHIDQFVSICFSPLSHCHFSCWEVD